MEDNLRIEEYPAAIAFIEREIFSLNQKREIYLQKERKLVLPIESAVISDPTLKNEQQRKIKREEVMQEDETLSYCRADIKEIDNKITIKKIKLDKIRNEFTVKKLLLREKISRQQLESELPLFTQNNNGQTFTAG